MDTKLSNNSIKKISMKRSHVKGEELPFYDPTNITPDALHRSAAEGMVPEVCVGGKCPIIRPHRRSTRRRRRSTDGGSNRRRRRSTNKSAANAKNRRSTRRPRRS